MKEKKIKVSLKRLARRTGGDRYESKDGFVIYIPQSISREDGKAVSKITITFSVD